MSRWMLLIPARMNSRPIRLVIAFSMMVGTMAMAAAPQETSPASAPSTPADRAGYLTKVVRELQKNWPTNRTINIVCHGHSVPAGYFKTPAVHTFDAYPALLHQAVSKRFPHAVVNVIVTAIGGEQSESGARRFERDVLSMRPDLVTIDYGLNDREIGLDRARAAWESMITNSVARGIKVILLTPTPDLSANLDDPNDPLNLHAAQIRVLAAKYRVGLVDSLELFRRRIRSGTPLESLMSQVNHPNRLGHELVAAELLQWFVNPPDA